MPKRILVAGGTGFVGTHITRKLLEQGHHVAVLTRNPHRAKARVDPQIELRQGDVSDLESLKHAMANIDVVISTVQFPNHPVQNPKKGHTYEQVDGEGTVRQVKAAVLAGVKRFIYISGAGTREGQTAPWFRAKLKAEKAVRESGMAYTIFRPSWVYGPNDRSLNRFAAFARFLPFMPIIGDGKARIQPVFVEDLAVAAATSITLEKATNKTYEIGGPETLTMDEIVQTMLQVMGKKRPLFHVPAGLMKIVTLPLTLLPQPPLSPEAVDFILMEEPCDNTALIEDFGITLTPLAEGLSYLK